MLIVAFWLHSWTTTIDLICGLEIFLIFPIFPFSNSRAECRATWAVAPTWVDLVACVRTGIDRPCTAEDNSSRADRCKAIPRDRSTCSREGQSEVRRHNNRWATPTPIP